jgi:hypothetical protein
MDFPKTMRFILELKTFNRRTAQLPAPLPRSLPGAAPPEHRSESGIHPTVRCRTNLRSSAPTRPISGTSMNTFRLVRMIV